MLSYSSTDEIIALKRVNWADPTRSGPSGRGRQAQKQIANGGGAKLHASAKVSLPPEAQGMKVDVSLYSDSYIGMVWKIEGVEIPAAPVVVDDGKKKEGGAGVWDNNNM